MHSIKLILPNHLTYFGEDGSRIPLMNFSGEGRGPGTAANIPLGHRALVYVTKHMKFIWAIEYVGTVEQGRKVAEDYGIGPDQTTGKWSVYLPIRILARVPLEDAPTTHDIAERTGIEFRANSFTMKYLSPDEYQRIYDAIEWSWTANDAPIVELAEPPALPEMKTKPSSSSDDRYVLPPIPDAEAFLEQVRSIADLPERNMEDLVKQFLIHLGYAPGQVRFQVGHVDVAVSNDDGSHRMVIEVKRSIRSRREREAARRQAFDYAMRCDADWVILTDADMYELYDRRIGGDYDAKCCGSFQLTRLTEPAVELIDKLRLK